MTDLVPRDQIDSWVDMLGPVGQLASQIARTQFVPKALQGQPASVAASILTGREMGLSPMTSLRGIQIIEGSPSLTSELLAARIFAAGHRIEWKHISDERVTVRIERRDGLSEAEITWTMKDAQRAGLAGKSNWQKYPRALLRARALSECAQLACPDVSLGLDVVASVDASSTPQGTLAGATTTVQVARPEPESEPRTLETDPESRAYWPVTPTLLVSNPSGTVTETAPEVAQKSTETVPEVAMVTRPQMRKIGALIGDYEQAEGRKLDRDERRSLIAAMAGVTDLATANDLTSEQASKAIDTLTDLIRIGPAEPEAKP